MHVHPILGVFSELYKMNSKSVFNPQSEGSVKLHMMNEKPGKPLGSDIVLHACESSCMHMKGKKEKSCMPEFAPTSGHR